MIVILSHRWDDMSRAIASRWGDRDVGVLTAQDLSRAGWVQRPGEMDGDTAVVGGTLVRRSAITGVVTLLPGVYEEELVDIAPQDRRYVAAEMTAFLLFWLSGLDCPVLNRPTPTCLSGPYWRREQWISVAARAGIPVQPVHRHAPRPGSTPRAEDDTSHRPATVTVVGGRIVGEVEPVLRQQARRLAGLAGVELLAVDFSSPEPDARFVSANTFPDLSQDGLADAVLEYLQGSYPSRPSCPSRPLCPL